MILGVFLQERTQDIRPMAPGTHSTYFRSQAEPSPALSSISTVSAAVGSAVTSGLTDDVCPLACGRSRVT